MMGNFGCAKMAKSQKKRHLLLLFILVSVRKLIEILQRWADRLEHYIESAGKDTEEITGKIELNNTVKMLTGLTILAVIASLTLTGWIRVIRFRAPDAGSLCPDFQLHSACRKSFLFCMADHSCFPLPSV